MDYSFLLEDIGDVATMQKKIRQKINNGEIKVRKDERTDVCPKCKGIGFILEKKDLLDDAEHYPEFQNLGYEAFYKYSNDVLFADGKTPTDTEYAIAMARFNTVFEFAVECPDCKGVSESQNKERSTEVSFNYKDRYYADFMWQSYDKDLSHTRKILDDYLIHYDKLRHTKAGAGLYIFSRSSGSGKTCLASLMLNSLSETYKVVGKFINVDDYLKKIDLNKQYQTKEHTDKYYSCDVLVLDDLGLARASETLNKAIYSLIDYRINNHKPTIITSNVIPSQLPYDARIKSRLELLKKVALPEVDFRLKQGEEIWERICG